MKNILKFRKNFFRYFGLLIITTQINAQAPAFNWAKNMGGTSDDFGEAIAVDGSGNIYTSGSFSGTADFDPGTGTFNLTSHGGFDLFISKLDANGNFVWAKNIGGVSNDGSTSIALDASGNIYTTGTYAGTVDFDPGAGVVNLFSGSTVYPSTFISKLDPAGNFLMAKGIVGNGVGANSIALDASGNIYTIGYLIGVADFDPDTGTYNLTSVIFPDIFISKLDASGKFVWAKRMGGSSYDTGTSIAIDPAGNVCTTGSFKGLADFNPGNGVFNLSSAGQYDIFISKLDASGNFVMAQRMGGSSDDGGNSLTTDASGNIYTTGVFSGSGDFDPGTGTFSLTSSGQQDMFISKLDASGNFVWAKGMGGVTDDVANSIAVDISGNIYTTGAFSGTADFDAGPGAFSLTSAGNNDIFILKSDLSGNHLWVKQIGDTANDSGSSIKVDALGGIYTTGSFKNTVDFDPGIPIANLTCAGDKDIFIHKMYQALVGIREIMDPNMFQIYPNPTNGEVHIRLQNNFAHASLKIVNTLGQTIIEKKMADENNIDINFSEEATGIYFVEMVYDKTTSRIKLLKN